MSAEFGGYCNCHRNPCHPGTRTEESDLANIRLFRRFQALEELGREDQQTVIRLIDAFIAQQRITAVLAPVD
ncbi:hypothetical protein OOT33_03700 [Sphingobium sp. DEHP117]|uniref:hypothetical protein n=1 Tax=Sphingobium sp. DEHP117 TaxID=2993436 RepID=UPI0027D5B4F9|nr:hypothetical protein [Sphingobium sp. DEHP117]MDQ4419543.1 hypothetical protein [Sphingobium sp. DEHP117]